MSQSTSTIYRDVKIIIPINNWFDRHYMFPMSGNSDKDIVEHAQKVGEDTVRKFKLRKDPKKPIRVVIYDQEENVVSMWVNRVEKKLKDMLEDRNDETGTVEQQQQQPPTAATAEERLQEKLRAQNSSRTSL